MKQTTCVLLIATALTACGNPSRPFRGDGFFPALADLKGADLLAQDLAGSMPDMAMPDMPDLATGGSPDLAPASLRGALVAGGSYLLGGVTSDDQVVAEDINAGNTLVAFPASGGGNQQQIAVSAPAYAVRGGSVFVWDGVDMNTHVGGLLLWSSMRPMQQRIASDSMVNFADASDDGLYIWYSSAADGGNSDLYLARWDGTSARRVISSAETSGSCTFHWQYAAAQLFVHYCPTGTLTYDAVRIDPGTGQVTTLRSGLAPKPFSVNRDGTRVLVADANSTAFVIQIGGGNTVQIDTNVADGHVLPDGNAVVLRSKAGELKRAPIQASPPLSFLVPNGCNVLQTYFDGQRVRPAISPDGKWILYSSSVDAKTGLGDLAISSTVGIDNTILSMPKTAAIHGDAFTADSLRTLSHRGVTPAGSGYIGQFTVQSSTGANAVMLGANSWAAWSGSASRVAFNSNWKAGKYAGRADIYTVNTAGGGATAAAVQAEADFLIDAARSHVLYSITQGEMPGVYSATIP